MTGAPNIARALDLIEEAQRLIDRAAQELCPVLGFANQWTATCKLYTRVHEHWYVVKNRSEFLERRGRSIELDGRTAPRLVKP